MQDDKIFQEFYCNDCCVYIRVRLNMNYNHAINVVCPMCSRKHPRYIQDGQIIDRGAVGSPHEDICPPKSACSKEPLSKVMMKNKYSRDGVIIKSSEDLIRDDYFRERWIELYGQES